MEIFKGTNIKMLDIETTGLNQQLDSIIELGVIEFHDGIMVREHSRLFGGGKSSFDLIKIHGIKDSDRLGKETFEQCAEKISSYLSNCIIGGHNIIRFDFPFIECKLKSVGCKLENVRFIDTCQLPKKLKVASVDNKLKTLCEKYGIVYGNHRGLADSRSSWDLLNVLIKNFNIKNINELVDK